MVLLGLLVSGRFPFPGSPSLLAHPWAHKIDAAAEKTNTAVKKTMTAAIIGPMDGIIGPTGPWAPALSGPSSPPGSLISPRGRFSGFSWASFLRLGRQGVLWAILRPFRGLPWAFPGPWAALEHV